MYESEVKELLTSSIDKMSAKNTFAPKALTSLHKDKVGIKDQRYIIDIVVVSKNHRQVLNWHDQTFQQGFEGLSNLSNLGFTSGSNAARKLDLAVQSSGETINNIFSGFDAFERDDEGGFDSITMLYPSESQNQKSVTVSYQGGHKWIPGRPQSILADSVVLIEESTFRTLNGNEDYKAKDWFVEFCDEKSKNCGDYLNFWRIISIGSRVGGRYSKRISMALDTVTDCKWTDICSSVPGSFHYYIQSYQK